MIYELRAYTVVPGKQADYLKINAEIGRPTRGQSYGTLHGSWTTEFGTLNQFVTIWSYADLVERERVRAALQSNEVWQRDYVPKIFPILLAMENKILSAQLPVKPPVDAGQHIYELRTYRTHVGKPVSGSATSKQFCPYARSTRRTSAYGRRKCRNSTRSCTSGHITISTTEPPCVPRSPRTPSGRRSSVKRHRCSSRCARPF